MPAPTIAAPPDPAAIKAAINRYAAGADLPARAIAGLGAAELDAFPVPGTWSIRQIVVHLADSDLIGSDRMKRIAAMDRPLLIGYDETAFIRALQPERLDATRCAELFRINRELTAAVLRGLPPEAFARWGVHNEKGKVTLAEMVTGYADHLDGHLTHLYRKRELLGKPLAR